MNKTFNKKIAISKKLLHEINYFRNLLRLEIINGQHLYNYSPIKEKIYKTHNIRDFTKEEWEAYEAEEYKKYIDKRNKKTSSLFVEENPPQDFALETNGLKEIKHFVMNSRSEQVPVYQYPSTMVAPIAFLPNGTVVEVLKKGDDGWCEVLSKDRKKGFIQSNFVKEN